MKKFIAWLLVLALTAAVSIGATLAYLTDTDEDVNVMTLGKVKIDQLEYERIDDETADADAKVQEFHDNKPLYPAITGNGFDYTPGDTYVDWEQIGKDGYTSEIWNPTNINNELDKMVFVKNKGDYDAYVRSVFAFEAGNYETLDEFEKMVHLNLNDTDWTWKWVETPVKINGTPYFIATATYNKVLAPGALTEISLSQIALDKTATNEDVKAFGETYQVLVKSQGIQADGFEDAAFALNEGFGEISENKIPWTTDNPIQGIEMKNALHYLEGDTTGAAITAKVSSITFGLNKDHTDIVNNHAGTLVDVEQDLPVYAYYVPKGSDNYDVYFLSNDVIHTPKNSYELFRGFSAMKKMDMSNLDVSRTENMYCIFRDCTSLTELDVSGWDTSSATDMCGLFYGCTNLAKIIGVEDLDTSNAITLSHVFYKARSVQELDLSKWDTGKATNMDYTFAYTDKLEKVNLTNWNWINVTSSVRTFLYASKLKEVVGSGDWYMPNNTDLYGFFMYCGALESIDVTKWDTGSCTRYHDMFCQCTSLKTVKGLSKWDTGSGTNMISMFNTCSSLEELEDLSGWDMRNINDFGYMFYKCKKLQALKGIGSWKFENLEKAMCLFMDCKSLTELDIANWNMSKVQTFHFMFASDDQNAGDMKLQKLDLSKWDTSSATNMGSMFYGCGALTELDLSDWNMPHLTTVSHMFADCHNLEVIDVSGWQTPAITCLDAMFNHCKSLKTIDLSSFDTSNVREFSQLFEHCYSLESVKGLEKLNTQNGHDFSEMFSNCYALKELNLSAFVTTQADPKYLNQGRYENWVFLRFMDSCTGLEKVTFGPNFSFDGKGDCPNGYKFQMPSATNVEGWDGKWYTADGTGYLPSEIPEMTAATYYAVKPATP